MGIRLTVPAPPRAFGARGLRCALPGVGPGMGQLLSILALTCRVRTSRLCELWPPVRPT